MTWYDNKPTAATLNQYYTVVCVTSIILRIVAIYYFLNTALIASDDASLSPSTLLCSSRI